MEDYSTASSKAENIPKMAAMPHWYRSTISEQKLTKKNRTTVFEKKNLGAIRNQKKHIFRFFMHIFSEVR